MPPRKRILLVDDEPQLTRLLKLNLDDSGAFEVAMENNALAALGTVAAFKPDLIVLDLTMPGLDGGEIAARLRAAPETRDIPIVFLTAVVSHADNQASGGQLSGAPCLAKPVNLEEFMQCITQTLSTDKGGG